MTVPPNAVAALVLLTTSYISDRLQSRGFMVISGCTLGGIGYMSVMALFVLLRLLLSCDQDSSGRLATFFVAAGTHVGLGLLIAWRK